MQKSVNYNVLLKKNSTLGIPRDWIAASGFVFAEFFLLFKAPMIGLVIFILMLALGRYLAKSDDQFFHVWRLYIRHFLNNPKQDRMIP